MAEERRIQLAAEVDTTRTREGFQEIGQQATTMAATVTAAGERAGRAAAGVGEGADRGARSVENAQRSLIGSIQRTTAAMEAGSRSSSQYFEVLARQRGVPTSVLEPFLAQLRAVEVAQGRANTALGGAPAALQGVEMSARATAAALRGVPAQLTDIVTSLQGGQAPLTVFLQQGGQLRDMFGSAGGAARALGSYVLSLITPLNLAAAAVVALGVAYHQGAQEAVAYNKALILSGNAAGTTADQLADMASSISKSVGTQGAAAEALAALAGTGRVSVANLQRFGQTAVGVEKAIGQSAADTAAIFAELGDAPLKASEKLNQQYRYLTAAIYDQISALMDQGRVQEAGEVAQKAYSDAMDGRSSKLIANLGYAERAWNSIAGVAKKAWDAMLGVGRADTLQEQLVSAQARMKSSEKNRFGFIGSGEYKEAQSEVTRLKAQIDAGAKLAALDASRVALEQAKIAWSKEGEQYLTRELQLKKDIALVQQQGLAAGATDAEIAARVGEVRKKYADIAFKGINDQIDAIERRGGIEEEVAKRSAMAVASARVAGIATSLAAQISYAQQVEAIDRAALKREQDRIQQRIALQKQLPASPENSKAQADLRAKFDLLEEQSLTRKAQLKNEIYELDVKNTREAAAALAGISDKRDAELAGLRNQIQAQKDANAQIGMSQKGVSDFSAALLEEAAARKEVEAAILDTIIGREQEAEKLNSSAAALRELAAAQREGVLKATVFEEQKQFWTSVERTAHDTFVSIMDGSKSAAQRLKDSFKNIFFDWLYSMTLKKWIVNVGTSLTGANVFGTASGASGAGGAAGAAGQVGSLLQIGKGMYDAISTGFAGLGASLGTGLVSLGGVLGSPGLGAFGAGLGSTGIVGAADAAGLYAAAGGTGSAGAVTAGAYTGAAVTAAAGIAAGVLGGRMLSGGYSVSGSGNGLVNGGTAVGAVIGTFMGPLGTAIGGAVGGLLGGAVNRLFGYKPKEYTSENIVGMLDSSGFSGDKISNWTQKGGLFRSNKSGFDTQAIGQDQAKVFASTYEQLKGLSGAFAKTLGADISGLTARSQAVTIAVTKDQAANEKAIADFFTGVADTLARELVPGLAKFQAEGESASAALQRLAGDYQAVESVLLTIGRTSQDAFGAIGLASIEARERLIAAAGGISALASGTAYFAENFLTLDERMAPIVKNVQSQLAGLGLANVKTEEQYKKTVLGIDLSTQAGADLYAQLLVLAPQFKQVTEYTESLGDALASAAAAQAAKVAEVNAAIQADIDALTKAALPLAEQRALEVKGMDASTLALYERREALQAEAKAAEDAKAAIAAKAAADVAAGNALLAAAGAALSAVQKSAAADKATATTANQAVMASLQAQIDSLGTSIGKLTSLSAALKGAQGGNVVERAGARAEAQAQIAAALAIAKAGGVLPEADSLKDALSTLSKDSSSQFSSFLDYQRDAYRTANDLAGLAGIADEKLSTEEKSLKLLQQQKDLIQKAYEAEIARLDKVVEKAQTQIDVLNGINTGVQALPAALQALAAAIKAAMANPIASAPAAAGSAYQQYLGRDATASEIDYWKGQAGNGVDVVGAIKGSNEAKIQDLYKSLLGRPGEAAGVDAWERALAAGQTLEQIKAGFMASDEYKKLHPFAVGTNSVPRDMPAFLHAEERVIPAADNRKLFAMMNRPAADINVLSKEFTDLRTSVDRLLLPVQQAAANTGNAAKTLQRVTQGQDHILVKEAG